MDSALTLFLSLLAATYVFLHALLYFTQDSKEPPAVETSIPFLSPLFGLIPGVQRFVVKLRDRHGLPIYTLRLPGQRIYVVNSLTLIPPLQRQHKTIAFAPIEAQAAATVMGVGPAGNAIIGSNNMFEHDSYLSTFVPSTHPGLSPGPELDGLNGAAIRCISDSLAQLSDRGPQTLELFSWVRNELFRATTGAIYGPQNPLRDPSLEQAWLYVQATHSDSKHTVSLCSKLMNMLTSDFEPGIMVHMLKVWPSVMARKSLHAREHLLIPAFERYFANNGHHQGSTLAQCRYKHNTDHGLRGRDIAATEISQMVASLTNSVGAAFWMVYHVFSDCNVLHDCRAKVEKLVQVDSNDVRNVDMAKVKDSCPILFSTWQETLRYVHIGIAVRVVMEDVMLDNTYLLRKGATVMTVAPVQHTDPSIWGPTAGSFDHRRFLPGSGGRRVPPVAFRAFGGGTVLCPGRHFVSTEIVSFVALLLLRFDVKPVSENGEWGEPRPNIPMTSSMPTPRDGVRIQIVPRDRREWKIQFSTSGKGVKMTGEDVDEYDSRA